MVRIPDIMELLGQGGHNLDPRMLRQFLQNQNGPRNQWLDIGPYHSYIRKGMPRIVDPVAPNVTKLNKPLDLANISRKGAEGNTSKLPQGQRPNKGKFADLVKLLEDESLRAGHDSVYMEQIVNEFLPEVLDRMGYRLDKMHSQFNPTTPSMYKRLRD